MNTFKEAPMSEERRRRRSRLENFFILKKCSAIRRFILLRTNHALMVTLFKSRIPFPFMFQGRCWDCFTVTCDTSMIICSHSLSQARKKRRDEISFTFLSGITTAWSLIGDKIYSILIKEKQLEIERKEKKRRRLKLYGKRRCRGRTRKEQRSFGMKSPHIEPRKKGRKTLQRLN